MMDGGNLRLGERGVGGYAGGDYAMDGWMDGLVVGRWGTWR